ncbi:MAG: hypothetical protein Q9185_003384 [Variospora sp. 1 TL-2023]
MDRLIKLVPRLVHLREVIWDAQCAMSQRFLEAVRLCSPTCKLYSRFPRRDDAPRSLRSLHNNLQLVAIDVGLADTQFQALAALRKLLDSCPNMRRLRLSCTPGTGDPERFTLCVQGWQMPPLKYLRLRDMNLVDYRYDGWEHCVQWEALEDLECTEIGFFPAVSGSLRQLRVLGVHLPTNGSSPFTSSQYYALINFAKTSSKLESLSVTGGILFLGSDSIWERTYPSLTEIQIYGTRVTFSVPSPDNVVGSERFIELSESSPKLQKCSIDLEIVEEEWQEIHQPLQILSGLADSLWFITELELHLVRRSENPWRATLGEVRGIWEFLWRRIEQFRQNCGHLTSRPRLQTLRVVDARAGGSLDRTPRLAASEHDEEMTFEARLSERDDLAREGHANVVCLELEGLQEIYGRRPLVDELQATLMEQLTRRAQKGVTDSSGLITKKHPELFRPLKTPLLAMVGP